MSKESISGLGLDPPSIKKQTIYFLETRPVLEYFFKKNVKNPFSLSLFVALLWFCFFLLLEINVKHLHIIRAASISSLDLCLLCVMMCCFRLYRWKNSLKICFQCTNKKGLCIGDVLIYLLQAEWALVGLFFSGSRRI